jgi:hypothetical protein
MKYILLVLISTMMTSCASAQKKKIANPEAPKESYLNLNETPTRLISTLNVPVSITLDDIEKQLNEGLKGLIYEDNDYGNNNNDLLKLKVWKNGKIIFTSAKNDIFEYTVPLKIWANKQISIFGIKQDKSTTFEMNLRFVSRFSIVPDWSIQTITTPNGFSYVSEPQLVFSSISIPITPIISSIISSNHSFLAKQIDESVKNEISIRPFVVDAWNSVRTPYAISEEFRTWMQITPLNILIAPLRTEGRVIKTNIGFTAYTETITGEKPETSPATDEIPPLRFVKSVPESFQVALRSNIPYKEATAVAKKMFVNETYKFRNDKYQITVTDVEMYGHQGKMIIKLDTKGDLNGSIYLNGVPYYNPAKNAIELTNTELDIKTRNVLVKMASWIVGGTLEKKIQDEFVIDLDEIITDTKSNIETSFNNEWMQGVKSSCKITTIQPEKITLTADGISTVVKATGTLKLDVKGM